MTALAIATPAYPEQVEDTCAMVEQWAEQCDDIPALRDTANRLAAIDEYLARTSTDGRARVAAAMRRLEVRIGDLLGPAEHAQPGVAPNVSFTDETLTPNQRHDFRQMSANPEVVEQVIAGSSDEEPPSRRKVMQAIRNPALYTSESPEWYTPPDIIERAVELLIGIDLDPCSNSHDTPTVPARHHFTQADDGLAQAWHGTVYMNPPYGSAIGDWIDKLASEHRSGSVTSAVALLPARTDTAWFNRLREWPRCFVVGRLRFSGHDNSAPFPSAVVYLGSDLQRFCACFGTLGDVYVRADP